MSNPSDFIIENGILTKYVGPGGDVVVPESVTRIDSYVFRRRSDLTSVTLAEGVISIGSYAFEGCRNLTGISLPESLCCIEKYAFLQCDSLPCIALPKGLLRIENGAFENCVGLTSVPLPEGLMSIGDGAFRGCKQLANKEGLIIVGGILFDYFGMGTSVVVPNVVARVANSAFSNKTLTKISLPDSVTSIGDNAFSWCEKLKCIQLPQSVKSIGKNAFYGCEGLHIELWDSYPDSPGKIAYDWDHHNRCWTCKQHWIAVRSKETGAVLREIYMGQSKGTSNQYREAVINGWGANTAFDYSALDSAFSTLKNTDEKSEVATLRLQYPEALTQDSRKIYESSLRRNMKKQLAACVTTEDYARIKLYAQYSLLSREDINTALESCASTEMRALLMELQNDLPEMRTKKDSLSASVKPQQEWLQGKEQQNLVKRYQGDDTDIIFPAALNGVRITGIANTTKKPPANYLNLVSVVIPEGYTVIGENAFFGCTSLKSVTLPETMQRLEKNCFCGCTELKEIRIPASVNYIGDGAFLQTGITSFELLADVQLGDASLGSPDIVIARGKRTGCFVNNHRFIRSTPYYVYSDGEVSGSGYTAKQIIPLAYLGLKTLELLKQAPKNLLEGRTVCCLGQLRALLKNEPYFPRPDLKTFVERLGGIYADRFNKDVDLMLVMEDEPENSTIRKAVSQGTTVMTELAFLTAIQKDPDSLIRKA